jgi:subtilisin family serine protease
MKRFATLALGALTLAACQSDPVAPSVTSSAAERTLAPVTTSLNRTTAAAKAVPGRYIVMLKQGNAVDLASVAWALLPGGRGRVSHVFAGALRGFVADIDDADAAALAQNASVLAVEPDVEMQASAGGTETSAPWGLDRLDQTALPLNTSYSYATDGSGVTVYIVDTGINYGHTDFGGRATAGYDAITSGGTAADCNGHGTHVAGTVAGTKYGVAKAPRLVGVRVLDCAGSGSSSGVIAGLDWVLQQKQANPSRPMVVNMSLGGGVSTALDNAVTSLVNAGVTVVVAAGNSTADACTQSPARAAAAITVGATDKTDTFASFSNYGTCVDVDAPGVNITSDYYTSTTATAVMSGTSMASPHTAGAAALYLAANPSATPAQVASALTTNASANRVTGAPAGTPNRLLYVGFLGAAPAPTNAAPTATITAPASGASVTKGASVTFTGSGTDAEDGALSGASLVWTSSIDGQIGTGATFATTSLSAGTHTITLRARDSKGATGTTTRTITVTAPATPPPTTVSRVFVYAKSGIDLSTWTMKLGATAQFAVLAYDASGKSVSLAGRTVTFASAAPAVLSVNAATGVGTAVAKGTFSVRATIDGVTGSTGNMSVVP